MEEALYIRGASQNDPEISLNKEEELFEELSALQGVVRSKLFIWGKMWNIPIRPAGLSIRKSSLVMGGGWFQFNTNKKGLSNSFVGWVLLIKHRSCLNLQFFEIWSCSSAAYWFAGWLCADCPHGIQRQIRQCFKAWRLGIGLTVPQDSTFFSFSDMRWRCITVQLSLAPIGCRWERSNPSSSYFYLLLQSKNRRICSTGSLGHGLKCKW